MSRRTGKPVRRQNGIADRARVAPAEQGTPTPFSAGVLYMVGAVLVAAAVGVMGFLVAFTAHGGDLRDFAEGEEWGENFVTAPMIILMVACVPFFLAEFTRRGNWSSRDRGFLQGGSNVVELRPVATWARLMWIVLALGSWAVLLPVPVSFAVNEDAFAEASETLWGLLATHGLFASGMVGVLLVSLVKRFSYDGLAARFGGKVVHGSVGQVFWRFVSYQFRLELWFGFLSGAILGAIPLVFLSAADDCYTESCVPVPDPALLGLIIASAAACAALALVGSLNAWRSGKSLYSGESVS